MNSNLEEALHFFAVDTVKIFIMMAVMIFSVSLIRYSVSPEKVRDYINGKPKFIGYLLAITLGALTPFCSCSSIPLFIGFMEAGVPLGITMSFLIMSPMVNEIAIPILGASVGWDIAFIYVITGGIIAIVGGIICEKMKWHKYVENYAIESKCCEKDKGTRIQYAISEVKDIVNRIWIYIIIGVGIGAFLHGFVPKEFFIEHIADNGLLSVPLAVILGVPLYSNAIGVIPIIEVLIQKGTPVGIALVFMMSVTSLSLPEMIILRKVLKKEMIIRFVAYLTISFILVGYLFMLII